MNMYTCYKLFIYTYMRYEHIYIYSIIIYAVALLTSCMLLVPDSMLI